MPRVDASRATKCHGWIMPLEAESANRVGRGLSARRGAESSSTLKNSARSAHPVSKNQTRFESRWLFSRRVQGEVDATTLIKFVAVAIQPMVSDSKNEIYQVCLF